MKTKYSIGSSIENDIQIESQPKVDRKHASINIENGKIIIEDNYSKNGTFVNGLKIHKYVIDDQDQVKLGDYDLRLNHHFEFDSNITPSRRSNTNDFRKSFSKSLVESENLMNEIKKTESAPQIYMTVANVLGGSTVLIFLLMQLGGEVYYYIALALILILTSVFLRQKSANIKKASSVKLKELNKKLDETYRCPKCNTYIQTSIESIKNQMEYKCNNCKSLLN